MVHAIPVPLFLLGFLALAGVMLYLTVLDAKRWGDKLGDILASLGFQSCPEDTEALTRRLTIVNERSPGKRLVMHLYRRSGAAHTIHFCDYRFGSASGKARGVQDLLVCLTSTKLDLPRLTVECVPQQTGLTGRLLRAMFDIPPPGLRRVETADPAFNRRYALHVAQGQTPDSVLPKAVIDRLLPRDGLFLDAQGDSLVLRSLDVNARRLDREKTAKLIDLAERLAADFTA